MSGEPKDDDELQNLNIPESKGSRDVAAPDIPTNSMSQPLKIQKVNIGSAENPKFSNVGDYCDEETMATITNLLHEFQDLFLKWFSKMKGLRGDENHVETKCQTGVTEAISTESTIQGPCEG